MVLERVHLFHLVRVLRVVVPLLVLGFAGLFAWTYLERPAMESAGYTEPRLADDMAALTEGVRVTQGDGGRSAFTVSAGRNLGYEGGVNRLEGNVEIVISGDAETPERRIRGEECGVRQQEGALDCQGGVEIDLDERTTARTELIAYDDASETATALTPVRIVRPGEFEVRANRMQVLFRERVAHLEGDVRVIRADGAALGGTEVWYWEGEGRVEVLGGVRLQAGDLEVTGERARALLLPDSTIVSRIEIRGEVRVESSGSSTPGVMTADELDAEIDSGRIERVDARGNARVESGPAESRRALSGEAVLALFDGDGAMSVLESVEGARMTLESGATIRSRLIRQVMADRAVTTEEASVLEFGELRVEGSHFRIEEQDGVQFATDEPALIELEAGSLAGTRTRAALDTETGTLSSLEQTGAVEFELDGRRGRAELVRIEGDWIEFRGGAAIEDVRYMLEADMIRLERTTDVVEADGSVFVVTRTDGEDVVVTSHRLRGRGEGPMHFEGSVVLRRGGTEVRAERIEVDSDGRAFLARGGVVSSMDGMTVTSDVLTFDDAGGRVEYSGNVEARTDELSVDSDELVAIVVDGQVDRIDASGEVAVRSPDGMQGFGNEAEYIRSEGAVTLRGPGSEARDPLNGVCTGDTIVVDIETHDVSVRAENGTRAVCVPNAALGDRAIS